MRDPSRRAATPATYGEFRRGGGYTMPRRAVARLANHPPHNPPQEIPHARSSFLLSVRGRKCLRPVAGWPPQAAVKPHALFADGAVLQQGIKVPVWGTAKDGEKVTVSFQGQEVSTTAKDGHCAPTLPPLKAGGPFEMTIAGENTIKLGNILVGEVWIASGQSNMQWSVKQSDNPEQNGQRVGESADSPDYHSPPCHARAAIGRRCQVAGMRPRSRCPIFRPWPISSAAICKSN